MTGFSQNKPSISLIAIKFLFSEYVRRRPELYSYGRGFGQGSGRGLQNLGSFSRYFDSSSRRFRSETLPTLGSATRLSSIRCSSQSRQKLFARGSALSLLGKNYRCSGDLKNDHLINEPVLCLLFKYPVIFCKLGHGLNRELLVFNKRPFND